MKIVLDSNVLLACIGPRSPYRPIWNAFINQEYSIVVTNSILLEYEEILLEKAAAGASALVMEILQEADNVIYRDTYYHWEAIQADEDDNKFFDAAIAEQVDYLVTNDNHFNAVKNKPFPWVPIISSEEFLKKILVNK